MINIKLVLELHLRWRLNEVGGECANLCGVDLSGANLYDADLCDANLRGARLRGVNLCDANLRSADLYDAHLRGANLRGVDLRGASLRDADLRDATLRGADLRGANLCGANLWGANLRGAALRDATLRGAALNGANLYDACPPHYNIVPEVGQFYAWKKTSLGVIKIIVLSSAKRVSTLVGRKCRASAIKVISGDGIGGTSLYRKEIVYSQGSIVNADKFDDDIRIECTHGIHFFMTKKEAEEW